MIEYKSFAKEIKVVYNVKDTVLKAKINSARDLYEFLKDMWPVDICHKEAAMAVYLNRANNTIGYSTLSMGGIVGTVIDLKVLLQEALLCNASNIIVAHNHPSGNLTPSESDKTITAKIKAACKIMDIDLLDHVIFTEESYFSFGEEGLL